MDAPNKPAYRFGIMLAILLVGAFIACLFSTFLPGSASLLAPTSTRTPQATSTPTLTGTPTITLTPIITFTPLPGLFVTSDPNGIFPYRIYDQRQVWESAVGQMVMSEDFEKDPPGPVELQIPYVTGNGFLLSGKSEAEILNAPEFLDSRNLLHFRAWGQGLTLTFPDDRAVVAFGFDYTTSEGWQLKVNNVNIVIISGRNQFVGVILLQNPITEFTLVSAAYAQDGLFVDNISYIP